MNVTIDELTQIISKVDGNRDLGASALAEAILAELNQRKATKNGPKPGREQQKLLDYFIARGVPLSEEAIPRRVVWYAGDVIKRMVARGWIAPSKTHHGCFEITVAGKMWTGR